MGVTIFIKNKEVFKMKKKYEKPKIIFESKITESSCCRTTDCGSATAANTYASR